MQKLRDVNGACGVVLRLRSLWTLTFNSHTVARRAQFSHQRGPTTNVSDRDAFELPPWLHGSSESSYACQLNQSHPFAAVLDSCAALARMLCILLDMVEGNVASETPGLSSRNGTILSCVKRSEFLSCVQQKPGSARNQQVLARAQGSSSLTLHHARLTPVAVFSLQTKRDEGTSSWQLVFLLQAKKAILCGQMPTAAQCQGALGNRGGGPGR